MKVLNVHTRVIDQPMKEISKLFETLSSKDDRMLATNKWSPMILDRGLEIGSKGGHGPIRYSVEKFIPGEYVQFKFSKPKGFNGFHEFRIKELQNNRTELNHTIKMKLAGQGILLWPIAIRWLHDAFIEDAFDKVEYHFLSKKKKSPWNFWVRFLRKVFKPRNEP
jgi:hypothetical protein